MLVDIGGGTTDLAFYSQGSIWHSEVIPAGGDLITKDIAIGIKASLEEAEQLKRTVGSIFPESVPVEEVIEVSEVGSGLRRTTSRRHLCQIIQARCDEILKAVAEAIQQVGVQKELIMGVGITGGGSVLDGIVDRAEQILGMPVRVGYPINVVPQVHAAFHPAYSPSLGLLKYTRDLQGQVAVGQELGRGARPRGAGEKVKNWLMGKIG